MCKLLFAFFTLICATSSIFLSDDGSSLIKAAALIKSLNPSLSGSPSLPQAGSFPGQIPPGPIARGCPLCDRSVYSYCSHKMVHDACCCNGGNVPFNCALASDCSYLNANSCPEHALIFTCCCNNPYH